MKRNLKIGLVGLSLFVANSLFAETILNDTTSGNYYLWVKNSTANDPFSIDNTLTLGLDQQNWNGENSTTIGNSITNYGNNATILGYGATNGILSTNTNNTIIGAYSQVQGSASNSTIIGSQSTNYVNDGIIVGSNSSNDGINSVVIGNNSYTNRANVVSFGDTGSERQLVNVANATLGTDAVNLNQLQSYSATTLQSSKDYTDLVFSSVTGGGISEAQVDDKDSVVLQSAKDYADDGDARTLQQSKDYTDARIDDLERTLTKDIKNATATSIALGVTPIFVDGNKNAIGIGTGTYKGANAVAINTAFKLNKNSSIQAGASLNSGSNGFKTGYSYSW